MKPLDSLYSIRLTDNLQDARRIIAGLEGRKGDYAPRTPHERSLMGGADARIETERTQIAISALGALAEQMGGLNNLRKTLLVVTEGFEAPARRRGQEYLTTIDSAIRSANRANVSIYPIDPRPASAAHDTSNQTIPSLADETMRSLADETDGRLTANALGSEQLAGAILAAVADADAYYMLTYRSAHREDGKFHQVEVRVKRARVQVRARSGYWAPPANDRLGAELLARGSGPPVIRLAPPRRISPLIQPWFGLSLGDDGKTRVTFVWEPSAAVPGDRVRTTAARLELTVLGTGDEVVFQGPVLPTGPGMVVAPGSEPPRAVFDTEPGPLRLRMKIQDASASGGRFRRARDHRPRFEREGRDRHARISSSAQRARVPHARQRSGSGAGLLAPVQPDRAPAGPVPRVFARRPAAIGLGAAAEPHGTADADARSPAGGQRRTRDRYHARRPGDRRLSAGARGHEPCGEDHGSARFSGDELDRLRAQGLRLYAYIPRIRVTVATRLIATM